MKLRLEPFEHFMFADDRPDQPMTYWLRATLLGTIERPRLEAALVKALSRQPLLCARLSGNPEDKTENLHWELGAATLPHLDFGPEGQPLRFPGGHAALDPKAEQPLRVFVRQGGKSAVLSLQFHHAAVDAIAGARFLSDVLSLYDDLATPESALVPQDAERIVARGMFQLTPAEKRRRLIRDWARAFLFFRKLPKPLFVRHPAKPFDDDAYPAAAVRTLAPSELAALKHGAGRARVSLNDVLLRDLFLALDDWNRAHGKRQPIRIAMPINMRRGVDDLIPAANVVSMCFLDRSPADLEDAARLQRTITRETTYLKQNFMGHALIMVVSLFGKLKGGIRFLLTPRLAWQCSATAVLSNLGDPLNASTLPRNARGELVAGGLTLTQVELLPPVRPNTLLAVGVVTYAGSTAMTFHYDHTRLEASEAEALAGGFHGHLKDSMVTPEPGATLFDRLVQEHTARRQGATAFYGLPIGKRVSPEAKLREHEL